MAQTNSGVFPAADTGRPVLVVAHPDDEALWFSAILRRMHRLVLCFGAQADHPELADARRKSIAAHPLSDRIIDLGLEESGSFGLADWSDPTENADGLALSDPSVAAAYSDRAADNFLWTLGRRGLHDSYRPHFRGRRIPKSPDSGF